MSNAITVEDLARDKGLPAEFLRGPRVGLYDHPSGGVAIPYWSNSDGAEPVIKRRTALRARDGSYWPKGEPPMVYGEWRLDEVQKAGHCIYVEGESDCWALWHVGIPALGIPGANNQRALRGEHLDCVDIAYLCREPDQGGAKFVDGMLDRLFELQFKGQARELRMPGGIKDPCQLLCFTPGGPEPFKAEFGECLLRAGRLVLPPDTLSDGQLFRLLNTFRRKPDAARMLRSILIESSKEASQR